MTTIETNIIKIIEPIINNLGYEVYDVIYEKEGKDNYLRIFIDNGKQITLEDCEKVNDAIADILDEKDLIKSQYFLEVSSPGLERRIRNDKQLEMFKNEKVEIHLFKAIDKQKIITGILKNYDQEKIVLQVDENEISVDKTNISKMKNVYNWEEI